VQALLFIDNIMQINNKSEFCKAGGFQIPQALQNIPPSNVGKKPRFYDQIAHK